MTSDLPALACHVMLCRVCQPPPPRNPPHMFIQTAFLSGTLEILLALFNFNKLFPDYLLRCWCSVLVCDCLQWMRRPSVIIFFITNLVIHVVAPRCWRSDPRQWVLVMIRLVLKSSAAFSQNIWFILFHDLPHIHTLPIEGSDTGHRDFKVTPLTSAWKSGKRW